MTQVRGRGLMIAIELERPCGDLVARALDENLLINVAAERVVRLLPPLVMTDDEADQVLDIVSRLVLSFSAERP